MPDMTPVGNTTIPPNPMQGINTLSGIIGLQQQRQNLQTGQYQQQTAQATAQQAQQRSQELQKAQALVSSAAQSGAYKLPDGSFDRVKASNDIAQIGPYAQEMSGQLLTQANEQTQNQTALFNLTSAKREAIGKAMIGMGSDQTLDHSKFIDGIESVRQQYPNDPEMSRMLTSMAAAVPPTASSSDLRNAALRAGSMATGESMSIPTTIDKGGSVAPGAANRFTGAFTPAGAQVGKTLPPQLVTTPAGPIVQAGGIGGGPSNGAAGGPIPSALNLTKVALAGQMGSASGITERVQQAQAAANNTVQAQDALTRVKSILESPDAPTTGTAFLGSRDFQNLLASAHIDTAGVSDMNSLVKNLARYEAARATQSGLGHTDAARDLSHLGQPNVAIDNKALLGIVNQSLASEKAISAYANKQSQTTDPQKLQANEAAFRSIPNVVQGYQYGMTKSAGEADKFLKEHGLNPQQMAETRQKIKQFESQ